MADLQTEEALEFDDVEFTSGNGHEFLTVPEDDYILEIVGYRVVPKPQQRIEYEAQQKKKTIEEIDPEQWEWTWEVAEGDYAGDRIKEWTNRSWHEKSAAGERAAALAGLEKYDRQAMIDRGFTSMRALMNKRIKAFVTETETKDGRLRNYIKNPRRLSVPKPRPQRAAKQDDSPAVPYTELPKDIFEAE